MSSEDWYREDRYPEWRKAPPWVMEDMVRLEPTLPTAVAEQAAGDAAALADELRRCAEGKQPVTLVACGTSEHAAQALAFVLNRAVSEALGVEAVVTARQALEAELHPQTGGLCVAVSHGGLSAATVGALGAAAAHGATTALITAAADSSARREVGLAITTPVLERSMCHTVAYVSPMLVGLLVESTLARRLYPAEELAHYLSSLVELETTAAEVARRLGTPERMISAGSGADGPAARELALKVAEGAQLPSTALELENVLHGHLVAHDNASALVVFVTDSSVGRRLGTRANQVLAAARRIGVQTAAVVAAEIASEIDEEATSAGRLVLAPAGVSNLERSLLGGALALQWLTIGIVHCRGTNPDLLRREQAPYREAVAIGAAKLPRD